MNLFEEFNFFDSLEKMIKLDEVVCKLNDTNSLQRSCAREALKQLISDEKEKLENIFQQKIKEMEQRNDRK